MKIKFKITYFIILGVYILLFLYLLIYNLSYLGWSYKNLNEILGIFPLIFFSIYLIVHIPFLIINIYGFIKYKKYRILFIFISIILISIIIESILFIQRDVIP